MIINCPACKTRFLLEDTISLGSVSRFHCNKCGHLWFNEDKTKPKGSLVWRKYFFLLLLLAISGGLVWAIIYPYRVEYAFSILASGLNEMFSMISYWFQSLF